MARVEHGHGAFGGYRVGLGEPVLVAPLERGQRATDRLGALFVGTGEHGRKRLLVVECQRNTEIHDHVITTVGR